eukprot:scaffold45003_cov64-Phaeocystis_antarctica.AAC.2
MAALGAHVGSFLARMNSALGAAMLVVAALGQAGAAGGPGLKNSANSANSGRVLSSSPSRVDSSLSLGAAVIVRSTRPSLTAFSISAMRTSSVGCVL